MFRGKDRQRDSFKDGAEHQNLSGTRSCRESRSDKKESSYQGRASRSNHPPGHYRHRCLPVVENETEAGSEPIPCGAYSGHTTHTKENLPASRSALFKYFFAIAVAERRPVFTNRL